MGACFSISSQSVVSESLHRHPAANVVLLSGEFRQYSLPATVAEVIKSMDAPLQAVFICDADSLSFDEYMTALQPDQQLRSATIYFVMPSAMLRYRLAASDMANLAVKASVALGQISDSPNSVRGKRKSRISAVIFAEPPEDYYAGAMKIASSPDVPSSAAGSKGTKVNMKRSYSKSGKLALRSFKLRLTTISEGSVLASV